MKRPIAAAALLLTLAACASEPSGAPPTSPPPANVAPPASPPPQSRPPEQRPGGDACGAKEAQRYVGRPRTEIPIPIQPSLQRVACTTCPITLEFVPRRLNFFFDAETGIIKEVKCG